jgi:hypothetical protein
MSETKNTKKIKNKLQPRFLSKGYLKQPESIPNGQIWDDLNNKVNKGNIEF